MHKAQIEQTITQCPATVQPKLRAVLFADDFCGVIPAQDADHLAQAAHTTVGQVMIMLLEIARLYAQAPISSYDVGAVSQASSGNLYLGANMEFVGQSLNATVHAEQAAVIHAWLHGEEALSAIAVTGLPCGHCRQFLNELQSAAHLQVITPATGALPLATLLPNAFGPASLGNMQGFLSPQRHDLYLVTPSTDAVTLAALDMANKSYAPYSHSYAGLAVQRDDGQIFAAPYAENAAFNPSLSPLQSVLVHMNLHGGPYGPHLPTIQKAVLVEVTDASCSQQGMARDLLAVAHRTNLTIAYAQH